MESKNHSIYNYEVFISYHWTHVFYTKDLIKRLSEYFLFQVCTDDANYATTDKEISQNFIDLVNESQVVIFCVTKPYYKSTLCMKQIKYAAENGRRISVFILDDIKLQDFITALQLKSNIPQVYDFFLNAKALQTWTGDLVAAFVNQLKQFLAEDNPQISFEKLSLFEHYRDLQPFINRTNIWLSNYFFNLIDDIYYNIRILFQRINYMLLDTINDMTADEVHQIRLLYLTKIKLERFVKARNPEIQLLVQTFFKQLCNYNEFLSKRILELAPWNKSSSSNLLYSSPLKKK